MMYDDIICYKTVLNCVFICVHCPNMLLKDNTIKSLCCFYDFMVSVEYIDTLMLKL